MMRNILLVSGGNDSTYIYHKWNKEVNFECYYFDYGQPYVEEELKRLPSYTSLVSILPKLKINPNGFVEGRNLMFILEIAKRYKECCIWVGTNKDDVFPDNSMEFFSNLQNVINSSFNVKINILLPLADISKKEIMKYINKNKIDTYSCYKGNPKPCGKCKACLSVKNAV